MIRSNPNIFRSDHIFELSSYIFSNPINSKSDQVDSNPIRTPVCPPLVSTLAETLERQSLKDKVAGTCRDCYDEEKVNKSDGPQDALLESEDSS